MKERIILNCPCEPYTGYGIMCMELIRGLVAKDYEVILRPSYFKEDYNTKFPEDIKALFVHKEQQEDYELIITWPYGKLPTSKRKILFTMWETTELTKEGVDNLNTCWHVIVPCEANKTWFQDCGVKTPISVVPLGINPKLFHFRPNNIGPKFVFGSAGRMGGFPERKKLNTLFPLFSRAFPNEADVELQVKTYPDDVTVPVFDTRIKLLKVVMAHNELADLMSTWNCGIFPASAEGWGLHQQEIQALGRPIIQAYWGGVLMFSNPEYGFPVDFAMVEAPNKFNYVGKVAGIWAKSIIQQMRYAYNNRMEVIEKGLHAARFVSKFTWENSTNELIKVLQSLKVIQ